MNYFLWVSGQEHGPYTIEQIRDAVADGTIDPHQTARTEDSAEWKPLEQVADLTKPRPQATQKPRIQSTEPTEAKSSTVSTQPASVQSTPSVSSGSPALTFLTTLVAALLGWLVYESQEQSKALSTDLAAIKTLLDKKATKPAFEYMVAAPYDTSFDTQMNLLGQAGWEIVSARRATSEGGYSAKYEVILKRQIR